MTFYRPGEVFNDVDDEAYIIFRGFNHNNVNKSYQFYVHEAVNQDESRKMLAEYDEVEHATDERVIYAWYFDSNNERWFVTGVQQWNLGHRGGRGDFFERYISVSGVQRTRKTSKKYSPIMTTDLL